MLVDEFGACNNPTTEEFGSIWIQKLGDELNGKIPLHCSSMVLYRKNRDIFFRYSLNINTTFFFFCALFTT